MTTSSLSYAFDDTPTAGSAAEILDGLYWLRLSLPFELEHINLWVLRDDDGWAVVDTGIDTDDSRAGWTTAFSGFMQDERITRVFATHLHPDHIGCAGWLAERYGVELWMTREEYILCRVLVADTGRPAPKAGLDFYRTAGFTEHQLTNYQQLFGMFGRYVSPLPESFRRLREGDCIDIGEYNFQILIGRGHSPEHACFFDAGRNLLIAGDQLLPTISSNVSVFPTEPNANPLGDWLHSLTRFRRELPEDVLVLPAHGRPFHGAHARLDELIRKHRERLERLLDYCREPRRVVDTFPALFRSRASDDSLIMATGEAIAHLNYHRAENTIMLETDADGVNWYRTVA